MSSRIRKGKTTVPENQLTLFANDEAPPAKPLPKQRRRPSERMATLEKRVTALEGELTLLKEQLERECDEDEYDL